MQQKPRLIATDKIRPNTYNPNRMSARQKQELIAEIQHLGTLPHPIVVRPLVEQAPEERYEIVDGEHRYHAAVEIGMSEVLCVVLEISDFEARRQTVKRNLGGKANKVLVGNTYRAMQDLEGKSRRQLSEEINVPEATIRAAEEYASAGDLRKVCAPKTYIDDIGKLNQKQVGMYLWLPKRLRDKWLEAGADRRVIPSTRGMHWADLISKIVAYGLDDFVATGEQFGPSLKKLAALAKWLVSRQSIAEINTFAQLLARHGLHERAIAALPLCRRDGELQIAISTDAWEASLAKVAKTTRCGSHDDQLAVSAAVRSALAATGIDLADVLGPVAAEDYSIVSAGPQFICDASDVLELGQQRWLVEVDQDCDDEFAQHIVAAKELTIATIRNQSRDAHESLDSIYRNCLAQLVSPADDLPPNDDDPATVLAGMIAEATSIQGAVVGDRDAVDVLRERLDVITAAEFNLLLQAVEGSLNADAGEAWLDHVRSDLS